MVGPSRYREPANAEYPLATSPNSANWKKRSMDWCPRSPAPASGRIITTILQPMPVRYTTAGMLPAPEVTHLGPLFEASRALDHWIASNCPESLYVGTFWTLCLTPLVLAILAVAVRPNRPRGRGRPPLFLALILGALLLARLPFLCYHQFNQI